MLRYNLGIGDCHDGMSDRIQHHLQDTVKKKAFPLYCLL